MNPTAILVNITPQPDSLQAIRNSVSMHPASSPLSKNIPVERRLVADL